LTPLALALANPELTRSTLIAGPANYVLGVVYRDAADFERIHARILTQLHGVMRLQTALTRRTVKRTTAVPI
jgi:Lrp/AsnC family transcriptional regulator, leucine-responsive regulatory protein